MNLTRITYTGKKPYTDREVRYGWVPGDTKLVPEKSARKLLRFPEFSPAVGDVTDGEKERATVVVELAAQQARDEHNEKEGMLMTVEAMDKGALQAYAAKYDTKLDGRKSEPAMRAEVAILIEQFGVR